MTIYNTIWELQTKSKINYPYNTSGKINLIIMKWNVTYKKKKKKPYGPKDYFFICTTQFYSFDVVVKYGLFSWDSHINRRREKCR